MKIKSILDGAAAVAGIAFPPAGLAIRAINAFLSDEDKLPETATGQDALNKFESLPPETQQAINEKFIELQIVESNNWAANFAEMRKADESGSSTRPQIAIIMAYIVAYSVVTISTACFIAIFNKDYLTIKEIADSWVFLGALLGTPTLLLKAYFGMRSDEKKSRYAASIGFNPKDDQAGLLSKIFK